MAFRWIGGAVVCGLAAYGVAKLVERSTLVVTWDVTREQRPRIDTEGGGEAESPEAEGAPATLMPLM